jgi:hypothetical protein
MEYVPSAKFLVGIEPTDFHYELTSSHYLKLNLRSDKHEEIIVGSISTKIQSRNTVISNLKKKSH